MGDRDEGGRLRILKLTKISLLAMGMVLMCAFSWTQGTARSAEHETLRQFADKLGFRIGAVMTTRFWDDEPGYRKVMATEFNAGVSIVFMRLTQPEQGRFNFSQMDRDIAFAREHKLKLFGAALVYRAMQCPEWLVGPMGGPGGGGMPRQQDPMMNPMRPGGGRFFPGPMQGRFPGSQWSAEQLDNILRNHIQTVVRHGGEDYFAWEVVNEPISNPNQPWERAFGRDEYISKAFRYAREANPNAVLLLNETFGLGGVNRSKADEFFDLVRRLKSSNVPIDAVGIEMHLEAQQLTPAWLEEFRSFLASARQAGVQAQVTEMDVYQGPPGAFADPMGNQRVIFHDVVSACLEDSNCKAFFTWGLSDAHTWLTQKRMNPRPDAKPLLFDANYERKPAYFGVLEALTAKTPGA